MRKVSEVVAELSNAFPWKFSPDFCWRCGNQGYWYEQIDGPDNLALVMCPNLIHVGNATINIPEIACLI